MVLDLLDTRGRRQEEIEVPSPRRRVRCDSLACGNRVGEDGLEPAAKAARGLGLGVPDWAKHGKDVVAAHVLDGLGAEHG